MRRAFLVVTLVAVSGVAQAQVASDYGDLRFSRRVGDQFYPSYYSGSVRISPSLAQSVDWMRGIPRNDTYVAYGSGDNRVEWNTAGPPRHRAATYSYYPQYPEVSHSRTVGARRPTYPLTPAPVTPYHDPFFEEHFWEDLEKDRDISDWWGW